MDSKACLLVHSSPSSLICLHNSLVVSDFLMLFLLLSLSLSLSLLLITTQKFLLALIVPFLCFSLFFCFSVFYFSFSFRCTSFSCYIMYKMLNDKEKYKKKKKKNRKTRQKVEVKNKCSK